MTLEATLKKLIRFKTLSDDPKENRRALTWVRGQLRGLPLRTREFTISGFPALVITTRRKKAPTLWLQAHIDVVAAPAEAFRPKVTGQRLLGRGAHDMKFAIACYLKLLRNLGKTLPQYDFGVMLTSDEEIGGSISVKRLLNRGFRSRACFLPDGGKNFRFEQSAKAVLRLHVESHGTSAHGSRPWLGHNAIDELADFLQELRTQFPKEPCGSRAHNHPSCNVGIIRGGHVENQVQNYAEAMLDIRIPPNTAKSTVKSSVISVARRFGHITVTETAFEKGYIIDIDSPYHHAFKQAMRSEGIRVPRPLNAHGGSDARPFLELGIPVILTRPRGGGSHGEKEWIDLPDLERFSRVLRSFVERVAQ